MNEEKEMDGEGYKALVDNDEVKVGAVLDMSGVCMSTLYKFFSNKNKVRPKLRKKIETAFHSLREPKAAG